ncbi:hypothetical protein [Shewanella xiamenensis]
MHDGTRRGRAQQGINKEKSEGKYQGLKKDTENEKLSSNCY